MSQIKYALNIHGSILNTVIESYKPNTDEPGQAPDK